MTLEQGYFITQIIAGIILIASILFLALQVKQNAKMLERIMNEDHRNAENFLFDQISTDRDFASFHLKIATEYDALDSIDKYRAEFLALKNLLAILRSIRARDSNFISDEEWQDVLARIRYFGKRKNVEVVWQRIKQNYPAHVRKVWEENAAFGEEKSIRR